MKDLSAKWVSPLVEKAIGDAIGGHLGEPSPVNRRRRHKRGLVSPPPSWSSGLE